MIYEMSKNMKYLICFSLIAFFIVYSLSLAEEPEFRVLGVKGTVKLESKNNVWKDIKAGDQIFKNGKIKVDEASYLGLVHISGRTIEIKNAGTYSVSKLSKEVASMKSSTAQKFAKFVVDEIGAGDDMLASKDYHRNMETTGAVERATGGDVNYTGTLSGMTGTDMSKYSGLNETMDFLFKNNKEYIQAKLPRTSYVIDSVLTFNWYKNPNVVVYEFEIIDINNSVFYSSKTSDTSISLNLNNSGLKHGINYYWYVKSENISSDQYCINWMTDREQERVVEDIEPINETLEIGKNAASLMILASYYEDENIMNRAVESYQEALNLEPGVKGYKTLYARYLSRIGLENEAMILIK
jgi:hypothetical protein